LTVLLLFPEKERHLYMKSLVLKTTNRKILYYMFGLSIIDS